MREKLRLSDLNVLYVCLDAKHGTNSHRTLSDVITFRNMGGNPLLICRKNSFIDKATEVQDIRRIHIDAKGGWRASLELYKTVRQLVKQEQLDLVHCYNYLPLMVLGFALKGEVRIPLVYTCNEDVSEKYIPFWHDYFITRVDQILCFSPVLEDKVIDSLPINPRKVCFIGAGLEFPNENAVCELNDTNWKVCCFVKPDEDNIEKFLPLFLALPLIKDENKKIILTFITMGSWYQHPHYELFKRAVLERGLEHQISFYPRSWGSETLAQQHLLISLQSKSPFEDFELEAILNNVPVLLPRTAARTDLLQNGTLGLTYQSGDIRELKTKALDILANYKQFQQSLTRAIPDLKEKHHFDQYASELYQHYERLSLQRLRFSLKRHVPFTSKS
ncbi:MAG: glycosyltransferase [Bacteriovoracaceae bacterium]|nr:glycosyltransferase [Bacteriovoracaceae bacterium]